MRSRRTSSSRPLAVEQSEDRFRAMFARHHPAVFGYAARRVGQLQVVIKRHNRHDQKGGGQRQDRGKVKNKGIRSSGFEDFLENQLEAVGQGLENTVISHPHGTEPDLKMSHDFALKQNKESGQDRN